MKKISETVAEKWGVPKDVIMDIPRITVSGDREIYIEHHKGVSYCTQGEVRIVTGGGEVCIFGKNLIITAIRREDVLVEGAFEKIEYIKKHK
ncbi:MAG: sporulation protein YqfC [Clostridia bacterium]|nr:sporulation protein YqfC [Clostridia bacterium]MBQ6558039.1 sporulation protein YqfC [Clostridia bacterium]MBQ9598426.1 sporulation protein YqfC [Clostridia bacterium]MBR0088204.1 sporulation protein YqfC [Clostridia bacterium]